MATSLLSTGVQFPDSTIQTTAATGGSSLQAVASGTLANGDTVIVNSDGTVSSISAGALTNPTINSPEIFQSANPGDYLSATYDSANGKVVIAYRESVFNYAAAVVGTISGSSISFGAPTVFWSSSFAYLSATYDSANGKVVIAFWDTGVDARGRAVVGTVSGTSISFGTPGLMADLSTFNVSATYDSTNNKVVIAYKHNNSNQGKAVVGTVSGSSISFGTATVFRNSSVDYISATYDSTNNKVVIAYKDDSNSNQGTAVVGTVSGTSISFGTPTIFAPTHAIYNSATYDSANGKVVIAYRDASSNIGRAVVGTVSGTSISFGAPAVFNAGQSDYNSATYIYTTGNIAIAYKDASNSSRGTVILGTVSGTSITFGTETVYNTTITDLNSAVYTGAVLFIAYKNSTGAGTAVTLNVVSTNLTEGNYIGISDAAYTNGQTATVQIAGSVDDAQSGLTAGQAYYVQANGALSTTAGTPEVFAGTAISSTKLIVKG